MKEGAPLRAKSVPSKVRAYGPGLEPVGVAAKAPANFTVETFGAGDGELSIRWSGLTCFFILFPILYIFKS
jgi:filamin